MNIIFGVILLISAVFLVIAVLMQSGKDKRLSGSIAGGAETFFGKSKGGTIDKKLSKLTTIVAVVFVLLVIITYVVQEDYDYSSLIDTTITSAEGDETVDPDVSDEADEPSGANETEANSGETEAVS